MYPIPNTMPAVTVYADAHTHFFNSCANLVTHSELGANSCCCYSTVKPVFEWSDQLQDSSMDIQGMSLQMRRIRITVASIPRISLHLPYLCMNRTALSKHQPARTHNCITKFLRSNYTWVPILEGSQIQRATAAKCPFQVIPKHQHVSTCKRSLMAISLPLTDCCQTHRSLGFYKYSCLSVPASLPIIYHNSSHMLNVFIFESCISSYSTIWFYACLL